MSFVYVCVYLCVCFGCLGVWMLCLKAACTCEGQNAWWVLFLIILWYVSLNVCLWVQEFVCLWVLFVFQYMCYSSLPLYIQCLTAVHESTWAMRAHHYHALIHHCHTLSHKLITATMPLLSVSAEPVVPNTLLGPTWVIVVGHDDSCVALLKSTPLLPLALNGWQVRLDTLWLWPSMYSLWSLLCWGCS